MDEYQRFYQFKLGQYRRALARARKYRLLGNRKLAARSLEGCMHVRMSMGRTA
jgi:hypothetical protein